MSVKGIEAGRAYVRTDADLSPLEKTLKTIEQKFKDFGGCISGIGTRVAGIGAGVTGIGAAVIAPIVAATKVFASFGDTISKTAGRTGISEVALSELAYAAEQSGTDLATVEKSISKMQRGLLDASSGSKAAAEAFEGLGLSVASLSKMRPEQQFAAVANAIGKVQDPSERAARAMQIFGRSGTQLLPMLNSDINALIAEAHELGQVIGKEDADAAAALGDSFDRVGKTIRSIFIRVGAAVAGPITTAANAMAKVISVVSEWVNNNRQLVVTIASIGAGLVAAGTVLTTLGVGIIGLGAAVASIGTIASAAFGAVGAAIAVVTSPITLAVAGIAGIGYAVLSASDSLSVLSGMFGSLGTTATTAWGGIVAAVSNGDLQTAGEIAFTALEVAWETLSVSMQQVWARVSDFVVNTWMSAVEGIVNAGASIYYGLAGFFDKVGTYAFAIFDKITTAIAKAVIKVQQFFRLIDADTAAGAIQILDEKASARAGERASGLSGRDARRRQDAEDFGKAVSQQFDRRNTTIDGSGVTSAQRRLADLQAKLAEQSSAAQAAAATQSESTKAQQAEVAQQGALAAITSTSAGSVGTFVSGVANRIAGGGTSRLEDISSQQLGALQSIDNRLREASDGEALG